jgi:hypothetical protein
MTSCKRFGFTPIVQVSTQRYDQLIERKGIHNLLEHPDE